MRAVLSFDLQVSDVLFVVIVKLISDYIGDVSNVSYPHVFDYVP